MNSNLPGAESLPWPEGHSDSRVKPAVAQILEKAVECSVTWGGSGGVGLGSQRLQDAAPGKSDLVCDVCWWGMGPLWWRQEGALEASIQRSHRKILL